MVPKKLLFLLSDLNGGGAEKVLITIAGELAKNHDFEVHLIVITDTGAYRDFLSPQIKTHFLYSRPVKLNKIRAIPKIIRLMRKIDPIASISTLNMANVLNILCSRLSFHRHKIIIREANTPSRYFRQTDFKKKILMFAMKILSRFAHLCVCPSQGVKNDVARFYKVAPEKLTVIPNPVDFQDLEEKSLEPLLTPELFEKKVILSVGRLTHAKGYDILLQAMPQVLEHHDVNLVILGEGPEKENLLQQAQSLGIENHVFLPGFFSNPYPFYKHADLFVLSSRWEGSPNALIHAIALEVPVVATNCESGPAELIFSKKLLSQPNNPQSLFNSIFNQLEFKKVESKQHLEKNQNISFITSKYIQHVSKFPQRSI